MDVPNPQLANIKAFLFEFVAHIEKVRLSINFPCTLKVTWKRGTQKIETKQDASLNKGEANFDQKLKIESNLYFDIIQQQFLEKKSTFTVVIATDKGSKVAGVATLDLGKLAEQQQQEVELDLKLEKCPDKTASLKVKVALRMIKEVDFSNMSQVSSSSVTHAGNLLMSDQTIGGGHHDTVVPHTSSSKHFERKLSSIKEENEILEKNSQSNQEIVQTHHRMESSEKQISKQAENGISEDIKEKRGSQKGITEIEKSELKDGQSNQTQMSDVDLEQQNQKIKAFQERISALEVENEEKNRLINELKDEIAVVKSTEISQKASQEQIIIREQQLRQEFAQTEESRAKQHEIESKGLQDTIEKLKQEAQASRESQILQVNEITNSAQNIQQAKENLESQLERQKYAMEQQRLEIDAVNRASEEITQKLQKDYEVVQSECAFLKEKMTAEKQAQNLEGMNQAGQIAEMQTELEKIKLENKNIREEKDNIESDMKQMKENLELEFKKEKQDFMRQIQELNEELQGQGIKSSDYEQQQKSIHLREIQELNDKINVLQEKNKELSQEITQNYQQNKKLLDLQGNIEKLEQEKQEDQGKYQKFNLDIQVLKDECEKYKTQIQTISQEKQDLQEERDTMKEQYIKIKEEKDALHEENKVIQAENYEIKNELERINQQKSDIEQNEITKWKNQVDKLQEQLTEQEEKARRDEKQFKEEIDEKQKEFQITLSQQAEQFRQLLEEEKNKIQKDNEDRNQVEERDELRKSSQDQKSIVNQEMVIRELEVQHQQQISHLTQTIQDLQIELNDTKSQKNQILLEMEKISKNVKNSKQDQELMQLLQDSLLSAKQKLGDIYNTALQLGGMELLEKLQNC